MNTSAWTKGRLGNFSSIRPGVSCAAARSSSSLMVGSDLISNFRRRGRSRPDQRHRPAGASHPGESYGRVGSTLFLFSTFLLSLSTVTLFVCFPFARRCRNPGVSLSQLCVGGTNCLPNCDGCTNHQDRADQRYRCDNSAIASHKLGVLVGRGRLAEP